MQFNYNLTFHYLQLFNNSLNFILLVSYHCINKFINPIIINCYKFIMVKNNQLKKKTKISFIFNFTENLNTSKSQKMPR